MIVLTNALDHGETLMEHVYPADQQSLPLMRQTLVMGLEIKLERTHDLSAVIHAERLPDGRIMITAMPLLYGSYTVTRGPGTFTLEPPLDLNLKAGWPLFKESTRVAAETRYRERVSPNQQSSVVAGLAPTPPPPAENALIRVEPAQQIETPKIAAASPPTPPPKPTARRQKAGSSRKTRKSHQCLHRRAHLSRLRSRKIRRSPFRGPHLRNLPSPPLRSQPLLLSSPPTHPSLPRLSLHRRHLLPRTTRWPRPRAEECGKHFHRAKCPWAASSRLLT